MIMDKKEFKNNYAVWGIAIVLIILGISARLLPHPANFAPVGAIALFGGLYLPRRLSILIPLLALAISDLFIGLYHPLMMLAVYGSFALMGYLGILAKSKKNTSTIVAATLIGSILFFLITNAAVWAFGTMYPPTIQGLWQSYAMALPFFRNSLFADFFFTGILVGSAELLIRVYNNIVQKQSAS